MRDNSVIGYFSTPIQMVLNIHINSMMRLDPFYGGNDQRFNICRHFGVEFQPSEMENLSFDSMFNVQGLSCLICCLMYETKQNIYEQQHHLTPYIELISIFLLRNFIIINMYNGEKQKMYLSGMVFACCIVVISNLSAFLRKTI